MDDVHAELNAELRRRARASTVTLDLGDGEGTPQGAGLRAAHERLEAARAAGDPARIETAEREMDGAVHEWRSARQAQAEGQGRADGGTPRARLRGRSAALDPAPAVDDRSPAGRQAWGVPVSSCRATYAPRVEEPDAAA